MKRLHARSLSGLTLYWSQEALILWHYTGLLCCLEVQVGISLLIWMWWKTLYKEADATPTRSITGTSSKHPIRGPAKVWHTRNLVLSLGVSTWLLEMDCILEKRKYCLKKCNASWKTYLMTENIVFQQCWSKDFSCENEPQEFATENTMIIKEKIAYSLEWQWYLQLDELWRTKYRSREIKIEQEWLQASNTSHFLAKEKK